MSYQSKVKVKGVMEGGEKTEDNTRGGEEGRDKAKSVFHRRGGRWGGGNNGVRWIRGSMGVGPWLPAVLD